MLHRNDSFLLVNVNLLVALYLPRSLQIKIMIYQKIYLIVPKDKLYMIRQVANKLFKLILSMEYKNKTC